MDNVELFKAAKAELGLNQAKLAAVLGKSKATVNSYECGARQIPDRVFKDLLVAIMEREKRQRGRMEHIERLAEG